MPRFKVYCHYGDRCVILKWPSRAAARAATPADAAARFCAAYRRRYGGGDGPDPAAVVFSAAPDTFVVRFRPASAVALAVASAVRYTLWTIGPTIGILKMMSKSR